MSADHPHSQDPAKKGFPKQGFPYIVEGDEGKNAAFCACGQSANLPFCDGSHAGTDQSPHLVTYDKTGRVAICGCGRSERLPYCDGSHSRPPT